MSGRVKIDVKREILQTLVDDLNSGRYFLPSFQRQYVWDEDDVRDLIDSMIKNYPVGTIILWKPSNLSTQGIDPLSKPLIGTGDPNAKEPYYVIDGQQRLTSLLLLLNDWRIERGGEEISTGPISYNPSNGKFYKSTKRGIDLSRLVKAFYRYDDSTIAQLKKSTDRAAYRHMEEMIKGLLNKYPIPICVMETAREDEETFREMAEAFIRINKYGIRIGNLELMLSFLAGAVSPQLKHNISDLYDHLYADFQLDLQPVIRMVFSQFGLKQTQISRVEQFRKNIKTIGDHKPKDIARIFRECLNAGNATIELLRNGLGIRTAGMLPSQVALLPIFRYFYNTGAQSMADIEDEDAKTIMNWFVLVSFNGYYSSQTDTKLDRDLEVIGKSSFPWRKLIANMGERKARVRIVLDDVRKGLSLNVLRSQGRAHLFLLYVLLVRNGADDWNGTLLREAQIETIARHHIFPKDFLEESLELEDPDAQEVLMSNVANITYIHKDINSEIEDTPPDKYLGDYLESARKHFVSTDSTLWSIGQYSTFLEHRARQIYAMGKKYLAEIFE